MRNCIIAVFCSYVNRLRQYCCIIRKKRRAPLAFRRKRPPPGRGQRKTTQPLTQPPVTVAKAILQSPRRSHSRRSDCGKNAHSACARQTVAAQTRSKWHHYAAKLRLVKGAVLSAVLHKTVSPAFCKRRRKRGTKPAPAAPKDERTRAKKRRTGRHPRRSKEYGA